MTAPDNNPQPEARDVDSLLTELLDASPFPAVISRASDNTVLAINSRTAELIGITRGEAVSISVLDYYVDPAQRFQLKEMLQQNGRADNLRFQLKRRTGEPFWVLVSARFIDWRGEKAVFTSFHDITHQLAAEAALKDSERRLAAQSDALTGLTARYADPGEEFTDRLHAILSISADVLQTERVSMWKMVGLDAIRCLGMHHRTGERYEQGAMLLRRDASAYFHAIESERVVAASDAQTDPRTSAFRDSYLIPNNIGAMLDVPLRQANETVGVLCAEHLDSTRNWTVDEQNFAISVANLIVVALAEEERRIALAKLAESEARARLIIDTAHDAFVGIDSHGQIVAWNAQAENTFGWTQEEAIGKKLTQTIIPPAFHEAHEKGMQRFHDTGIARILGQRLELTARHKRGHDFPVELTIAQPVGVQNGFFFGAFMRDISARIESDAELRRAKESAESATRAKSEFLANMSHELRTPLNGVLGYAQLLQRDRTLNASQREGLDAISKCGSQLLDLINDVLDLSKIEAGRLDIDEGPTNLHKLITDLRYVIAERAQQKGLGLEMTVRPNVPRSVILDGRHLRQVLLNLLGNSIKFTHQGLVRLDIGRSDGRLTFDVTDTGIGIEKENLSDIFRAFTQTKEGAEAGGTGLGLTISNHLIHKMQGELKVESTPGEGSRFYFSLPLVPATASDMQRETDSDLTPLPRLDARLAPGESLTALVVDDSTANRRILASLLESAGIQVITAAGGYEALELAHTHLPQVIFMDLKMDDLHGLEVTRRLKKDPVTKDIVVIAVTASIFGEVRQTAEDVGCADYLTKPVRAESLFAVIQKHLGVRFVAEAAGPSSSAAAVADMEHRTTIAKRLRAAVQMGDVAEIQTLANALMGGSSAEAAVGQRLNKLAMNFDFDGINEFADQLVAGRSSA